MGRGWRKGRWKRREKKEVLKILRCLGNLEICFPWQVMIFQWGWGNWKLSITGTQCLPAILIYKEHTPHLPDFLWDRVTNGPDEPTSTKGHHLVDISLHILAQGLCQRRSLTISIEKISSIFHGEFPITAHQFKVSSGSSHQKPGRWKRRKH